MLFALDAIVHREIDDAQRLGQGVRLHELAGVAVSRAEEETVNLVQRELVGKHEVGLAEEPAVDIGYAVARVTGAVYKNNLYIGVIDEQPQQLTCGVSRPTYDSYFYHVLFFCSRRTALYGTCGNYQP